MSIKAMPKDTSRLIGSTSLISSPAGLVRELVDNAIDARASSIDLVISRNTVDRVEVRDNGCGIGRADFPALGRPAHSSKKHPSEATIGPPSLGFRGQGLASANNLGRVTITTRTTDDATVGSTFQLTPNVGGVQPGTLKNTSAVMGTTVCVTELFAALPVRHKLAVQEALKTMGTIKTLLTGYALARPSLRLSFRVLAGGGEKSGGIAEAKAMSPWSYRPVSTGIGRCLSLKHSVTALFGVEVARQCQEITISSNDLLAGQATLSQTLTRTPMTEQDTDEDCQKDFFFEACLPQPSTNYAKLKLGSFISVDGRPLSADTHGSTAKKLASAFCAAYSKSLATILEDEAYLSGSQPQTVPPSRLQGLFIRLNIRCPPGSYDANVEASKTDVLFTDEQFVIDMLERVCKKAYGQYEYEYAGRHAGYAGSSQGSRLFVPRTPQRPHVLPASSPFSKSPMSSQGSLSQRSMGNMFQTPAQQRLDRPGPSHALPVRMPLESEDAPDGPVRIPVGSLRRGNRPLQLARPAHSPRSFLAYPRDSSGRFRGRINRAPGSQRYQSPNYPDLPGLSSSDNYRQTVISFSGARPRAQPSPMHQADAMTRGAMPADSSTHRGPALGHPQYPRPGDAVVPTAGLNTSAGQPRLPPSQQVTRVIRVDMQTLRRSAARFARNVRAWEGGECGECGEGGSDSLSPETMDICSLEARLKMAVKAWVAKQKAEKRKRGDTDDNDDDGPLKIELYLRNSLKKKVLAAGRV